MDTRFFSSPQNLYLFTGRWWFALPLPFPFSAEIDLYDALSPSSLLSPPLPLWSTHDRSSTFFSLFFSAVVLSHPAVICCRKRCQGVLSPVLNRLPSAITINGTSFPPFHIPYSSLSPRSGAKKASIASFFYSRCVRFTRGSALGPSFSLPSPPRVLGSQR